MEATENFYDSFTSSLSDTRCGRGFRAFLNNPVGTAYFDSNKEEEGNTVQEMSKLMKKCFLVRLLW